MSGRQAHRTEPSAPLLRLHLFGGFRAIRDHGPALAERWPRPGARALVKLLAVTPGHRLHRDQAVDVCWPDADPQAALRSLRVALHAARHALEPELAPRAASSYLVSDGSLLLLDPATVWIDTDHAEETALAALAGGDAAALADAAGRFTGELLPEDRYAPWAASRRDRLSGLRERVLLALATAQLAADAHPAAAATVEQVLTANPAEEAAHRILMESFLRRGLRRLAVRQYHLCREALDAELGVRPGPETERLHRTALTDTPAPALSPPSLPVALRTPAAAPLRGRDEVLARLLGAGGPPVTLLTGEAGVGKTSLAREAARRAARSGTAVLWGGGHDAEGHTPYGAFAEALDGWLAEWDAAERARVGADHPELAAFLPSLGRVRADGERSPEEERDRLFRAGAALLGDLAAGRPVLVVLDDLHAADTGSYQLLGHLARRAAERRTALRFLVTYREEELPEGDPRRSVMASLARQRLAVREELGRLDKEACLAVVRDAAGGGGRDAAGDEGGDSAGGAAGDAAHDERARRVWELSLGNPLFALELARGLPDERSDNVAPEGVRELVADRLLRLDTDARRVVEALSAAGGEAALTELLDVAEHGLHPPVSGAAAADALERAIAASLVDERQVVVAGRPEAGVAFRHPLVRLTCYEQLSAVRRRGLHAAFAQAVLRRRPDAVDALASHFARADDARAAAYLRRAAERAAALYANDTADRYYRDLVARLDVDAARARLAHSHVLRRMGHFEEAAEALRLALAEFERRGDHDDAVLAAALLAEALAKTRAPGSGRRMLRAHPVTADTAPEPAAGHFLALAVVRCVQGRYAAGAEAARHALTAARKVPGTRGQGLTARAFALQAASLGLAGRLDQARAAGDQALAPAEAYGDPTLLGSVLSTLRENARRAGRLHEAVRIGNRALALAEQSGDPVAAAFELANLAELRLLLEEPEPALALAERAVSGAEAHDAWCLPHALATMARVRVLRGETERAAAFVDRAEEVATALGDRQAEHEARTARVELALSARHPDDALRALDGHADDAPVLAAWAELLSGRPDTAQRLARAEVARAERTGERLAEVEARIVLGTSLTLLARAPEGASELARAESSADSLPYPAGTRRASWARGLLDGPTRH
ncbi:DNA-binding SARP family transcriptional activator/predicted ATPase [Streptomyces sp. PvR006]|uniref:ATP-binding protein n=1 Tax=Streptomyces sp. PvR006 TaxID=2817860 RepID=UPI001AEA7626|nr:AAA family ATPase [Streptomyces sp. PvR006]MBP2585331.1 DNA-binding SARP family transcriptional activator/predicted ATPase [Streptomyces sp. PvR006]